MNAEVISETDGLLKKRFRPVLQILFPLAMWLLLPELDLERSVFSQAIPQSIRIFAESFPSNPARLLPRISILLFQDHLRLTSSPLGLAQRCRA